MKQFNFILFCTLLVSSGLHAQADRWQQEVDYKMVIDMDVEKHQYSGSQRLTFTNNSPDVLDKVFYHLYFNAFQPGSAMNVRQMQLPDGDSRMTERLAKFGPEEIGWIKVSSLEQDGQPIKYQVNGTILEVDLAKPIQPNSSTVLEMEYKAQIPLQTRRSGRDNREGIDYSMSQWYPKLCNYDYQGWHANPYIAREFYGIWGDFDVKITIDKNYLVAAGGYLQNPNDIGRGYEEDGLPMEELAGDKLTYHFKAPNVHDFVWAADRDYHQVKINADDGTIMRFFYQKGQGYDEQWEQLPAIMNRARTLMNENCGKYPYKEYAFIQGGDGGMEYPLATLITGDRPLGSLVGVSVHEQLHSWYQMILGSNEALYPWMDEGFTSYAETLVENQLAKEGLLGGRKYQENPFAGTYGAYRSLATSGREEPMTTHSDHYHTNYAYGMAAYVKGNVFLHQLGYIIGEEKLASGLLRYFDTWKFKHPNTNDVIRVFEKESGLELDWYKEDWVNTTNVIDYGVDTLIKVDRGSSKVVIRRNGDMAMPLDIEITYKNGKKDLFYAPLDLMRGEKDEEGGRKRTLLPDHRWVDPVYEFDLFVKTKKIVKIEIDPSHRMADIVPENNVWEKE